MYTCLFFALTRNARVAVYSLFKAFTAQNSKHSKSLPRAPCR